MLTEKSKKIRKEYFCINCNYKTCDKKDYNKHLLTTKHKNNISIDISLTNLGKKSEKSENSNIFICKCGKNYKSRQGIYLHKKKCNFVEVEENNDIIKSCDISNNQLTLSNDVVLKLLNDNQELKSIIMQQQNQINKQQTQISELIPKVGNNNTINNNQKFNIHVFLNEQCKDALNLSDFVKSLHVTLEQLDYTKQNGLADGISKTIIDNMSKLSIYERPMHCTDIKRETLYVKENDNWEKDNNKEKIKHAIKKTSSKNYDALVNWKTLKPNFMNNEDNSDYFTKTISTIGKSSDSIDEKVIKKLCKETYVKESV